MLMEFVGSQEWRYVVEVLDLYVQTSCKWKFYVIRIKALISDVPRIVSKKVDAAMHVIEYFTMIGDIDVHFILENINFMQRMFSEK